MSPELSVVVPAYNVEGYVLDAVRSVLNQTAGNLEIIVVDDGSTDDTVAALSTVDDSRMRVLHQANAGLAAARNTGIRATRGAYIGFLDADDIWYPQKAERQLTVMRADPGIGVTFCHSHYLDERGHETGRCLVCPIARPTLNQMIRRNHVGNGSAAIVRADCFAQAGLFDERLGSGGEDYEMWVRILARTSFSIMLVPEVLTGYRVRPSSLSSGHERFIEDGRRALEIIAGEIPNLPKRVLREGLAGYYRIASRKAASAGSTGIALRLYLGALRRCPWLPLIDARALGTLALIIGGNRFEDRLYRLGRTLVNKADEEPAAGRHASDQKRASGVL